MLSEEYNFLKMRVSEIRVKQIRVNQGLGVLVQSNLVIRNFLVTPNVPYPYEVNGQLVTGNGSLTSICF